MGTRGGRSPSDSDRNAPPALPWGEKADDLEVVECGTIQLSHTYVSDNRGDVLCIYAELDYGLRNWIESSMWCDVLKSR